MQQKKTPDVSVLDSRKNSVNTDNQQIQRYYIGYNEFVRSSKLI